MGLWGKPEVAALCVDSVRNRVSGVLMRMQGGVIEVVRSVEASDAECDAAIAAAVRELNVRTDVWLLVGMNIEQGAVIEAELPDAKPAELAGALGFEAARELLTLPEDFRVEFVKRSEPDENSSVKVRGYLFPNGSLLWLTAAVERMHRKIDAFLYPILALPADLPDDAKVAIPELEDEYYFQNGVWKNFDAHTTPETCNRELLEILRRDCRWNGASDADWSSNIGALVMGHFACRKLMDDAATFAGVNVLPAFLRPARFRNQIRVMMILLAALVLLWSGRGIGSLAKSYRRYRGVYETLEASRNKVEKMRKKLKTGEKELKELTRVAEFKIGSRECVGYLGLLSENLPDDVLVSNYRWNEGTIDLMLQTQSADLDLVALCNRLRGFKVLSANQRTNNNTNLTVANVKLTTDLNTAPKAKKGKK